MGQKMVLAINHKCHQCFCGARLAVTLFFGRNVKESFRVSTWNCYLFLNLEWMYIKKLLDVLLLTYRVILGMIQLTTSNSVQHKVNLKYATRILLICVKNATSIFTQIKLQCVLRCITYVYKSDSIQKTLWDFLKGFHLFSVLQFITKEIILMWMLLDFMLRLTFESKWIWGGLSTLKLELLLSFD